MNTGSPTTPTRDIAAVFTATHCRTLGNLSYKALADLTKGLGLESQSEAGGWRRFTLQSLFALLVCAEIRDVYGIPASRLRWFYTTFLADPNRFTAVLNRLGTGNMVYVLTDLHSMLVLENDTNLREFFAGGALPEREHFLLFNVGEIVRRMMAIANREIATVSPTDYELIRAYHEYTQQYAAQSESEREVLDLIRNTEFDRVTLILKDGHAIRAEAEKSVTGNQLSPDALLAIIDSHAFQTVEVKKRDGKVVYLTSKTSVKLSES